MCQSCSQLPPPFPHELPGLPSTGVPITSTSPEPAAAPSNIPEFSHESNRIPLRNCGSSIFTPCGPAILVLCLAQSSVTKVLRMRGFPFRLGSRVTRTREGVRRACKVLVYAWSYGVVLGSGFRTRASRLGPVVVGCQGCRIKARARAPRPPALAPTRACADISSGHR